MNIQLHQQNGTTIAEVTSEKVLIRTPDDSLQLMVDLYYQGYGEMILHEPNITPDFFDLKTGMAGEILQKFATYRVRLAIVGDFARYESKSLRDFIFESNKGRQINFLSSVEEAVAKLSI
ncbi:DUF4180 domain-containing protein [Dyadobacter endophyticus]|uniref:DUF4180 domain-containing protein n=1 Tax=Dyadobacter endophyticus TaxID=1749036 RepID=A0ABQ1YRQ3_9BACT|nr:DUF4180 domain-containing protein [Dyadobacter endophyticus]GGH35097.1 hypothetical protein GCM10007423_26500 [Dyadobacter endophyticus]